MIRTNQRAYREALDPEERRSFDSQYGRFRSAQSFEQLMQNPARLRSGYGILKPNGASTPYSVGVGMPLIDPADITHRERDD
jgi:hypothetical protein